MKKLIIILMSVLLFSSCSEEVENPIANFTWPAVHCLLNCEDSVHYLRLGKTFSGSDLDPMMRNPDSLYYREANVFFDIIKNNHVVETIQLEVEDGLQRDPGVFPATPFRLYKTDSVIEPGIIGLRIELPEENRYVAATIGVRGKPYFYSPEQDGKRVLEFYERYAVRIRWNGCKESAETTVRLRYLEFTENGIDTCKLDWYRAHFDFVLTPDSWFDYMLYSIKDDYHVRSRKVVGVDIIAAGGNGQLCYYLAREDVVFDLIGKPFSNVTGAYGFVGSRSSGGLFDCELNSKFLDSLANSPRLERLKFVYK